jgi:tetratricopeptide (TPR) repeat protein
MSAFFRNREHSPRPAGLFFLKLACILGLSLALLGGLGVFVLLRAKGGTGTVKTRGDFARQLAEFDRLAEATEGISPEKFNSLLNGLEKKALSVESHLAVLKRRRNLALYSGFPPEWEEAFIGAYGEAADRTSRDFPASGPLAALAAEALVLRDPLLTGENAETLQNYLARIRDPSLLPLAFSLEVLSGKMADPQSAAAIPQGESLFAAMIPRVSEKEREQFLVNQGILRLLAGDTGGCRAIVNALLAISPEAGRGMPGIAGPPAPETLGFGAEFFYDFGDPPRGADLFSRLPGEKNLGRQADALWLSGHADSARNIWHILASPQTTGEPQTPDLRSRSLYNLASTAAALDEKTAYLERLFTEQRSSFHGPGLIYGVMGYTRLLDRPRALAILEEQDLKNEGLLDLERFKRKQELWTIDRAVAELWLLLGRHPQDERLYRWGAYYFDRQKYFEETAFLIKTAGYNHLTGPWIQLNQGIRLIQEGVLDEGEAVLRDLSGRIWQADANIALVHEARRSNTLALEYYEAAAAKVRDKKETARIQFNTARCLRALGRPREARRALEYAEEADPENLTIRLELHRLKN